MPIPDAIVPKEIETPDQKKARERWEAVSSASNAMLAKALECDKIGAYCFKCTTLCDEMKEWERVADASDKK